MCRTIAASSPPVQFVHVFTVLCWTVVLLLLAECLVCAGVGQPQQNENISAAGDEIGNYVAKGVVLLDDLNSTTDNSTEMRRRVQQKNYPIRINESLLHQTIYVDALTQGPSQFQLPVTCFEEGSSRCEEGTLSFRQTVDGPVSTQGNWSVDTEGRVLYWPNQDAEGSDQLYFTAIYQSTNSTNASTSSYTLHSVFNISIVRVSVPPRLFLSTTQNELVFTPGWPIELLMEQRTGKNVAYSDLLLTLGAYDLDASDWLSLRVTWPPRHGRLYQSHTSRRPLTYPDCDKNITNKPDIRTWQPFIPCDTKLPKQPELLSWLSMLLTYVPDFGFYGVDKIKFRIMDHRNRTEMSTEEERSEEVRKAGLRTFVRKSAEITVILYVVRNPCINGGVCRGQFYDEQCTSPMRVMNFDQYECVCPENWHGQYCQYHADACYSNPCRPPSFCVREGFSYRCECPQELMACREPWASWKMACITTGVGIFIAFMTVGIIVLARRRIDSTPGFLRRQ